MEKLCWLVKIVLPHRSKMNLVVVENWDHLPKNFFQLGTNSVSVPLLTHSHVLQLSKLGLLPPLSTFAQKDKSFLFKVFLHQNLGKEGNLTKRNILFSSFLVFYFFFPFKSCIVGLWIDGRCVPNGPVNWPTWSWSTILRKILSFLSLPWSIEGKKKRWIIDKPQWEFCYTPKKQQKKSNEK